MWLGVVVAASAVAVNVYPFKLGKHGVTHGVAPADAAVACLWRGVHGWRVAERASGVGFRQVHWEFVIYCMLIGLGGVVFMMLTMFFFSHWAADRGCCW